MKQIEVDFRFIKDAFLLNKTITPHVSCEERLADIIIKTLGPLKFSNLCNKLYLDDIYVPP